ncbi:hypothetical protein AB0L26_29285 [Streptomyces nondiastaticus]|uniref:hypothetical protein n=1 Tax=Streptomyces nondiastaticus TaxID=3154512 RepID=UPI0034476BEF
MRTWDESATATNHESLTLRAPFDHDATGRDIKWIYAAYGTPVSDLLWDPMSEPAVEARPSAGQVAGPER